MKEKTKKFVIAALVRALYTFCEAALGFIGGSAAVLGDVDWLTVLSGAVLATIISLLKSIVVGLPEVGSDDCEGE